MKEYTDEQLDALGLSEEERAALLEGDDDHGTDDGGDGGDGQGSDDDRNDDDNQGKPNDDDRAGDVDGDGDEGGQGGEGGDDGQDDQANAGRDDGSDDDDQTAAQQKPYTPNLSTKLPDDLDEKLASIDTQKKALRQQYNDGDIDFDEYESKRDELDDQRNELKQAQFKASIAGEMRTDRWLNHDVPAFMAEHPQYQPGTMLFKLLDEEVRLLQGQAESEGKDPLDPSFLAQAHQKIMNGLQKDLGITHPSGAGKTGKPAARPPADRNAPPTLGNLPASEAEDTDGGRWATLDRLADSDPEAYEERLARMSEADRDAYMAAR